MKQAILRCWVAGGLMLALAGCAAEGPREGFAAADPYESVNRVLHKNNVRADRYILRPAAQVYGFVTPTLFKHLIDNGLKHLYLPKNFANYLLQGDVDRSLNTLGRFTLNTVLGAGGLLDPATEFGLVNENTDFGVTLGKYGVGEGFYIVLPLLGPSTLRDSASTIVDRGFSPLFYTGFLTGADVFSPILQATELLDRRDRNKDLIDDVLYESVDSYVTLRSAYLQRRRAKVAGDEGAADNLPDIFDDEKPSQ